jgi:hypothetical protein
MQHDDPTLATIIDLETRRRRLWDAYDEANDYGDKSRLETASALSAQLGRAWEARRVFLNGLIYPEVQR